MKVKAKTIRRKDEQNAAEELVRQILVTDFGQRLDKKTIVEVAKRVRSSVPQVKRKEKISA